jgi:hypothetical protein
MSQLADQTKFLLGFQFLLVEVPAPITRENDCQRVPSAATAFMSDFVMLLTGLPR